MQDATYRSYKVATANAELPVTLEAVRFQLRNEDLHYDDDHVRRLIRAAADQVERGYGLALLTQTIEQYHHCFPGNSSTPMLFRIAPLISVTSIKYWDADGVEQTWSNTEYQTGPYNLTAYVLPKPGYSWPSDLSTQPNAVKITYQAGFGASTSSVPNSINMALMLSVSDLYNNRDNPARTMSTAADRLLEPFWRPDF